MKSVATSLALAALLFPAVASAEDAPPPVTGNVTLSSEYLYRGIAQTAGKPAVQGGLDYSNPSGFYAGAWGSNISWLSDVGQNSSVEIDIYGGFKGAITEEVAYDVGILTYNYPGRFAAGFTSPNTREVYGAVTYKFLTVKYSRSFSNLFGVSNSKGSGYLEANLVFDLGDGWGANGHVGHQTVKNLSGASYSDWKIGVTKDTGLGVVGLAYSGTNAKDNCKAGEFYCFTVPNTKGYEAGKSRLLLTYTKSL